MKALYKIAFSLFIFMFIVFFIGQDVVNGAVYEKVKIENTSNIAGSLTGSSPESSNDEDVTFFLQPYSRSDYNSRMPEFVFTGFWFATCCMVSHMAST